ncbi:hypothetical protein LPC08_13385 [Roseomonas sp. OT10]|uniref:hypothetical protein n=1 Tax=Roseomonas cutis TaxID=2897332 RepID=UPI001E5163F9|nr:hypothetical protein [Roseomonas sp. OT10]UFN47020.1 hypothetical protein LPC08_13385 [Roseomonas sp. OT10]
MAPAWDGVPDRPDRSGWHWVEDGDGLRPLLWRGGDWADPEDRHAWKDGFALLSPHDLRNARYFGPVEMPRVVADRFRLELLFGLT